jgi:hypothetical protein
MRFGLKGNWMQTIKWILLSLLCFITCEINASSKCTPPTVITEIPPSGIVINLPGTYVFGNNITWSPSGNGQAIFIQSKDVILDLQSHTLASETTSFNTTGIVALLSENLTIKNGTIANMAFRGIDCEACSKIVIEHITIDGLNIENTAIYTVPVGILVSASNVAYVYKCAVKNIDVKTGSCAAIQMTGTTYSRILNCNISNLLNRDGACTGIGHLLCNFAEVRSCALNGLESQFINNLNTQGHTAIGLIPFISTNLSIQDCTISNITGCCDDAHGISVFECTNAIVKNCKVSNVLDGAGPAQTGAKATGIEVYGSDIQVIKCSVKNILAINPQDKQATGFSCAQGSRIKFIKCHAKHVKVYDQNGNQAPSLGYGTGFGWAPDPRIIEPAIDVLYKHCSAKYCQLGFDSWFHIDSVWDGIYSKCNDIDILNQDDSAQRTLSCDACSECGCLLPGCYPTPFTITIDNIAKNNIFLDVKTKNCK